MTTRDFPGPAGRHGLRTARADRLGTREVPASTSTTSRWMSSTSRAPARTTAPLSPITRRFRMRRRSGMSARATEDAVIDLDNPDVNLNNWYVQDGGVRKRILTVNGTQYVILRFDLSSWSGRQVADHGLLELTTHSVQKTSDPLKDFGLVRVVEIMGGDPAWDQKTVTARQPSTRSTDRSRVEQPDDHRLAGHRRRRRQDLLHHLAAGVAADYRWADAGDRDQAPRVDQRIVLCARAG